MAGRAPLVGVQAYASSEIEDLAGPRGDVSAGGAARSRSAEDVTMTQKSWSFTTGAD